MIRGIVGIRIEPTVMKITENDEREITENENYRL
jgi:hypothetical protein